MRTSRHKTIADAAVRVLAEKGARGLTHRAVDTAAGLPFSSTGYYCKTREALLELAMDAVLSEDMEDAERHLLPDGSVDFDSLLEHFSIPANRMRALARFELFLEAARNKPFREKLMAYRQNLAARVAVRMNASDVAAAEALTLSAMEMFESRLFHAVIFSSAD